jgi:Tol biopolymer transport system component
MAGVFVGRTVPDDEARTHLARVLGSAVFARADRQKRFLSFALENTLAGDRERLKEPVIGHEVFDRLPSYDPKTDAIVRVEANRLRKKLGRYYQSEGRNDPIRLTMPPGGYLVSVNYASEAKRPDRAALVGLVIAAVAGVAAWVATSRGSESRNFALTPIRLTSFGGVAVNPVLTRDGAGVIFAADPDGGPNLSLWVQSITGGTARRLTPPGADAVEPDLSPDGSTVVFSYRHPNFPGIYTVPLNGGEPTQVALLGSAPRYSPDGRHILFTMHNSKRAGFGKIFVVDPHGGSPDELVPGFADAHNAIWSEDGRRILFCGTQVSGVKDKEHDWWILPFPVRQGVDQPVKTGLLPEFALQYAGSPLAVPPNSEIERPGEWYGGRLFFASVTGGPPSLWIASISGSNLGTLTRLTAGTSHHSTPRCRNGKVVFAGGDSDIGVWRISADSRGRASEPQRVTGEAPNEIYPAVSPDGKWLAYVSDNFLDRSQPRQVRLRHMESGSERILRRSANTQGGTAFSRDGTQLAFSEFGNPQVAIYTAPTEGGEVRKVCVNCGRVLDWSPDGRRLLYEAGANVAFLAEVEVATGKITHAVTHPENSVRSGRYSPDGKWVIFNAETGREAGRVFVAPAGRVTAPSDWVPVSPGNSMDAGAAFSPDGGTVYYALFGVANGTIFSRAFDTRTGQPAGAPAVVHAFDTPRRGFSMITPWHIGMSVSSANGIFLSLEQRSSEIYIADLRK